MATITAGQIQRVYALGATVGILESGNKDDDLHALVSRVTGKEHISELSSAEFTSVEHELLKLMKGNYRKAPSASSRAPRGGARKPDAVPGMMTPAQQSKAWRYIYRLCELDGRQATPGERMCGAIKTILSIDARVEAPFKWVNQTDGGRLIDMLKRYVDSAERKAAGAASAPRRRKKKEVG
jgi:hypothetical protein